MTSDTDGSRLDDCLDLYLHTWELLGDQAFTPADLAERLVERDRGIEYTTAEGRPERHLHLLVAYGLLGRTVDDRYRIRCAPDEDLETWQKRRAERTEAIYRNVRARRADRSTGDDGSDAELLRRRGATFADVPVDDGVGFDELTERVAAGLENAPRVDGVVLRAPAELTGHVQRLADGLCDRPTGEDADRPAFEKATADVVGEHKDDLEYRLYLRAAD
jgi:hypothetical protein